MNPRRLLAVARYTLLEALRARLLTAILVATVTALGLIVVIAQISVGADKRVMTDLGASAVQLIAIAQAFATGISLVFKEYERRTLFPLLATPLGRAEYLVGKFFGLLLTSLCTVALSSGLYFAACALFGAVRPSMFLFPLPLMMELAVLTAAVLFFAAFATPAMTAVFSIGLFLLGRSVWGVETLTQYAGPWAQRFVAGCEMLIPALQAFNFTEPLLHGAKVPIGDWFFAVGYGTLWCVVLLAAAALLFERREIV